MRINKWIPIVLAINIGVLCFALYVATTYQQQNYIVSCEQPITNYSIVEGTECTQRLKSHTLVRTIM